MSAPQPPPPAASAAGPANTVNGTPQAPLRRRKPDTNPLRQNRRAPLRKQLPAKPTPAIGAKPTAASNGAQPQGRGPVPVVRDASLGFVRRPPSPEPEGEPNIVPVFMSKRDILEGLRYHVGRFQTAKDKVVDLRNEAEFTRPVMLHRRDPQASHAPPVQEEVEETKDSVADDKERERLEAQKLERQRLREETNKLIAPNVNAKKKPQGNKKKTEQIYRANDTPEEMKKSQLRYEEALPWHIEDDDNKNIWQGNYEAVLSENHVIFVANEDNGLRLIPVEKYYKFKEKTSTKHIKQYTFEEAEKAMNQKFKAPAWVSENQQKQKQVQQKVVGPRMLGRRGGRDEARGGAGDEDFGGVAADADDIDFDLKEEFADDEENALFEGDDDTVKDSEDRIKREQLEANHFDKYEEKEVDEQIALEEARKKKDEDAKKEMQRRLLKKEKRADYERDDSDDDLFGSSSTDTDEEAEKEKEAEAQREEERKAAEASKAKDLASKPASATSTTGTNTPSGRKEKKANLLKPGVKRPGSPNLSEASGNESSRKKAKKGHLAGTSTPVPLDELRSRQGSQGPNATGNPLFRRKGLGGAGSGSDSEATGGEKKQKLRLRFGSTNTSPQGSRAGSPGSGVELNGGSRAQSPGSPPAGPPPNPNLPPGAEILAHIPPEGIPIQELTKLFKERIAAPQIKDFIILVKHVARWDAKTKLLFKR